MWSVVLYGYETWTLRIEEISRLEAFEMWIRRRLKKISWIDHVSNEEMLKRVKEKRRLIKMILQTAELDWTYSKRQQLNKRDYGRMNVVENTKGMTKTENFRQHLTTYYTLKRVQD